MYSEVGELKYNTLHQFRCRNDLLEKTATARLHRVPFDVHVLGREQVLDQVADKVNAPSDLVLRGAGEAYGDAEGDQWA